MAKNKKDDVTVVSIGVGTMPAKKLKEMKKKAEMAYGGMATVSYTHLTLPTKRIV